MAITITEDSIGANEDEGDQWQTNVVIPVVVGIAAVVCLLAVMITISCESRRRRARLADDETVGIAADDIEDKLTIKEIEAASQLHDQPASHIHDHDHSTDEESQLSSHPNSSVEEPTLVQSSRSLQGSSALSTRAHDDDHDAQPVSVQVTSEPTTPTIKGKLEPEGVREEMPPEGATAIDSNIGTEKFFYWLGSRVFGASPGKEEEKEEEHCDVQSVGAETKEPEATNREVPNVEVPDVDAPDVEAPPSRTDPKCFICGEFFSDGDLICQSNNPKCLHQFHQPCMKKWLKFQNRCPCCNETYVVQ